LLGVQWGDVRKRVAEIVALVAGSPILADLATAVTGELENGSTVLLAVDDGLANMPMHAIPVADAPWADIVSIERIPAAGILRFTPPNRGWSGRAVVAGDSNKDLPGAHRECAAVADKLGVAPIVGKSCTFAAVRDAVTAAPEKRLDVVHLAVHGRADARHALAQRYSRCRAANSLFHFAPLTRAGLRGDRRRQSSKSSKSSGSAPSQYFPRSHKKLKNTR
jgi:hypothetical protein